jgi:hypothetical protein
MPREKETYRDNLELLLEFFPNKKILTVGDVSKFAGCDPRTAAKRYPFDKNRTISVATLARTMS